MGHFSLYHISDLHFAAEANRIPIGEVGATEIAHRFFRTLSSGRIQFAPSHNSEVAATLALFLVSNPDVKALLVSGDLATTGHPADLRQAHEFFNGRLIHGRAGIERVGSIFDVVPTILLPGNHDRFEGSDFAPRRTRFESSDYFGPHWRPSNSPFRTDLGSPEGLVHSFHLRDPHDGEMLSVCCADFTVMHARPKCYSYIGRGAVDPDTLTELEDVTRKCKQTFQRNLVIWAVHFPPKFQGVEWSLDLEDGDKLVQAADRSGVPVILAGHTHEAREYPLRTATGSVKIISSGSTLEKGVDTEKLHFQSLRFNTKNGVLLGEPTVHPLYYRGGQYSWS